LKREEFIEKLFEIGAVKFGTFTLKSGKVSPFYFDLRDMISYPELLDGIVELLVEKIKGLEFDVLTGIPYTALPIASLVADRIKKPLIYMRKEEKAYGTGNNVIGKYKPGAVCLVIDDLITTGESKIETAERLEAEGVKVKDFVVVIDRSNNGSEILGRSGYQLHSLIDLDEILAILKKGNYIDEEMISKVKDFTSGLAEDKIEVKKENLNSLTIKLQETMKRKKSNLILSLDVTNQKDFFEILDKTASEIVMLKTHADILEDYDQGFIPKLQEYSKKCDFHIFEDRKFADIGNTVRMQYRSGIYKIADWSEFVTVHLVAGAAILDGLFGGIEGRSSFLARMSSKDNLINDAYTRKVLEAGRKNPEVVSGFIGHGKDKTDIQRFKAKFPAGMMLLMPGVKLESGTDKLGQQYITVEEAIAGGADCIIVGRGIIKSENPGATAKIYRERAWKAYIKREK